MRFNYVIVGSASIIALVVGCTAAPAGTAGTEQEQNPSSSSGKPGSTSGSPGTSTSSGSPGTSTSSGSPGTSTSSGSPDTGGTCAAKADQDACYECCETLTPEIKAAVAAEEAIDKRWQTCACAASKCGTACATDYCKMDPWEDATPGSACETCLEDNTDDCDDQTDPDYEALEKTPGYIAYEKCEVDSKCDSKPE